jgi:dihydroorotase (multifunctional complex type)
LKAFLQAHPEQAELKAIEQVLMLSEDAAASLHVCHVTTKYGLDRIAEAKQSGKEVTCEVTPHHLLISQSDLERLGTMLAVMPPVRSRQNAEALQEGISNGQVDIIGSDHAPHTAEEKSAQSIWDVKVGFPGLETTLPLLLTMVAKHKLSLDTLVTLLSEKPAKIFKLKGRGCLKKGSIADLVAVNFKQKTKIDASKFHSKAKFSPFDGKEVQGKPIKTFVSGLLIMDDHIIVGRAGSGTIIRSSHT